MRYFLRSSVKSTVVKPLSPSSPFDFLTLISEGIAAQGEDKATLPVPDSDEVEPPPSKQPRLSSSSDPKTDDSGSADTATSGSKRSNQNKANAKRARKRREQETKGPSNHNLSQVLSHGVAIEVDVDAASLDSAKGAHTGKPGGVADAGLVWTEVVDSIELFPRSPSLPTNYLRLVLLTTTNNA
ncbi:hypothetical protein C8R42DRAFT_715911 [Lentinula raphanica]|nr:hypothetical protein C8R42DRAFT_715911 [Lentinula raphanica]